MMRTMSKKRLLVVLTACLVLLIAGVALTACGGGSKPTGSPLSALHTNGELDQDGATSDVGCLNGGCHAEYEIADAQIVDLAGTVSQTVHTPPQGMPYGTCISCHSVDKQPELSCSDCHSNWKLPQGWTAG